MSVSPGTYNFVVQRRASFSLALQFKDSTDAAIDLTGATVAAQAWDAPRTTKYADFAVAYTNRSNGQVQISLTDTQTATFPDILNYDVLVTTSAGLKNYYLEGQITVSQGYTA
jgi:hypothetical protein|tara:strand:- start:2066 stop:2404 length:339 start_codon:yes stop_codon:yes gene_type:complete